MNRANKFLFWAVGFIFLALLGWVYFVSYLKQSSYDNLTLGISIFGGVFPTVLAVAYLILWNKVRHGAENSRLAERIISRSNRADLWLPAVVKGCSIIAIISWVYLCLGLAKSSHDSEDIWLDAAVSVFWTVVAIGFYIYWKRKKHKQE
jgi:Na+/proline symporter